VALDAALIAKQLPDFGLMPGDGSDAQYELVDYMRPAGAAEGTTSRSWCWI
jgi:hypothetical protein